MTTLLGATISGSGQTHSAVYPLEAYLGRRFDAEHAFKAFPGYATRTVHIADETNSDIVYTALAAGVAGEAVTIAYQDIVTLNVAESVAVTGTHILVTLGKTGGVVTSTANSVLATLNASAAVTALVSVELGPLSDGTGLLADFTQAALAGGNLGMGFQSGVLVPEGRLPAITLNPIKIPGSYSLADDANLYPAYVQMWQDILAGCYPYSPYIRVHCEMNAGNHLLGPAADYIAWYRRVAGDAYIAGLAAYRAAHPGDPVALSQTCVRVWNPTSVGAFDPTQATYAPPFYPGDDVVDKVGCDTYERTEGVAGRGPWTDASIRLEPMRLWARTNSRGASPSSTHGVTDGTKQIVLCELGCCENLSHPGGTGPSDKSTWWTNLGTYLASHASDYEALFVTSTPATAAHPSFRIESSAASEAAFKAMAASAPFTSPGPPPPPPPPTYLILVNGRNAIVTGAP